MNINLKQKIIISVSVIVGVYLIIFFTLLIINKGNLKTEIIFNKNIENNSQNTKKNNENVIKKDIINGVELNKSYSSGFSPKFGNPDAKISVIMFIDFDCPYCLQEYSVIRNIMTKYKDIGYFEFRNMPLETLHPNAGILANASMCANSQGKFWEMFDKMFLSHSSRQEIIDESDFIKAVYNYGKDIGLNMDDFSKCYDENRFNNIIDKDFVDGISYGVNSTPTFFINGTMVSGVITEENWEKIFDLSLEKK
ncbi:MAG: thioredoxin domain-containing protein [Patescibacteria group bacterium]